MRRRVAVVGAGWSGLACALELLRHGRRIVLFDVAAQAGGRARGLTVTLGDRDFALDNGQHLLIGGYRETLRLMQEIGVDIDAALLRLPFEIRYPDGFELRARRLPGPLHLAAALLAARGLDWTSRRHALAWVWRWHRRRWTLAEDAPASTLFVGAPATLCRRLWRPLCLAALNVELEQASAQVLLNVLRDSLAAETGSSDLLIPRHDLSQAFAAPAIVSLRSAGTEIFMRSPVQGIANGAGRWRIDSRGDRHDADAVVLALPPERAAALLASTGDGRLQSTIASLRAVEASAIATVYLRYTPNVELAWPACTLLDDAASGRPGQWVFDRGRLDAANAGVLGVVVSAAGSELSQDTRRLVDAVGRQLGAEFGLPAPLAATVITEKRATIVPSPGLQRPAARLAVPGLYLAGDAAASDYPSTLEGSVRAGLAAARALLEDDRSAP
jgi:squalene-associated FAD-dependent desaturase